MKKKNLWTPRKGSRAPSRALCFCLSALLSSGVCLSAQADAQPQEQEETLETLGSQIHTSLGSLKARCQILTDGKVGDISIGTVQYTYEATAPYGWLFLQGQTLSRTTFKKLWDWASANNYVGSGKPFGEGNGTTTFTLPNLSGEFIRTTGVNPNAHQGNGSSVGYHQDATIIPNFLLNYNNGFEFFGMGHLQVFSNFQDYAYNDPSDQVWVDKTNTGSIGQTHMTSFTTRPTNTSLNIKMKVM